MQPLKALCYTVYALTVLEVLSVSCVNGLDQSSVAVEQRLDASDGFEPGCSVLDCGAFGGGKEDDTEAFRHCWRACSTVTVPAGEYLVAQLDLSGVGKQLRLLDGARLIAPGPEARDMYGEGFSDWYTVALKHCRHCSIIGEGHATIDGRAQLWVQGWIPGDRKNVTNWHDPSCNNWKQCRPRLLGVSNSSYITLSNLHIIDSVFWTTHIINSSYVTLTDLYIRGDYNIPNNDGIDVDSSVNVVIKNVDIETADDAICIKTTYAGMPTKNVLVSGGRVSSRSAAIKFGSETHADIHNITIENIEVRPSHRAIGVQLRDQGNMSGITVRNIRLTAQWQLRTWWGAAEAIVVSRLMRAPSSTSVGRLKDMLISNVTGVSEAGVVLVGHADFPIERLELRNIHLSLGNLTAFPGGYRDLRPGPADLEEAALAALYARNVRELIVSESIFKVPGGAAQRSDWGAARQVAPSVASYSEKNVQFIDER